MTRALYVTAGLGGFAMLGLVPVTHRTLALWVLFGVVAIVICVAMHRDDKRRVAAEDAALAAKRERHADAARRAAARRDAVRASMSEPRLHEVRRG